MIEGQAERRRRVLDRAAELQVKEDVQRVAAKEDAEFARAVGEAGVDPKWMAEAERQLVAEEADAKARAASRRRWMLGGAGVVGAGALLWGASAALAPEPTPPWSTGMDTTAAWGLDVNPGSAVAVRWEQEAVRGQVAVVEVTSFAAGGEKHRANFDSHEVPASFDGLTTMHVDLAGTLPVARVYLEAGGAERWRSPALNVEGGWSTKSVPLSAFDHQVREGAGWKTAPWATPTNVDTLSVKLGDFMNPADATGVVRIDNLGFE
jgi:hypothetical protein